MAIISKTEFNRLVEVSQLQNLCDNSYLKDEENENFKWIKQHFFYGDKNDTKLFNVWSWLFWAIQNVFTSFVGNPNIWKKFNISERVNDYIATWYCAFVLFREGWKLWIRREPSESVSYENWVYKVIKIYVKDVESSSSKLVGVATTKKTYVLVQTYWAGTIENKLYEVKWLYQISSWTNITEVSLQTIFETEALQPIEETGFEFPTIFLVKNKEDELMTRIVSVIKKVINMVYAIDRRVVMFDNQFLNNVESFILMKNIVLPKKIIEKYNEWKKVNFRDLWRILTANDDGGIEFINNKNELIDKAIEYEEKQIRRISASTTIPTDFLWLDNAHGAIGEWSRTSLHSAFIKSVEQIRDVFTKGLKPILEIIEKENKDEEYNQEMVWNDVFSKDDKALVDELKVARDTGLISQLRAIQQYLGLDKDEAEEELLAIQEENAKKIEEQQKVMENEQKNKEKEQKELEKGKILPNKEQK